MTSHVYGLVVAARTSATSPTRATTRGTTASGCGPKCCSTRSATSPACPKTFGGMPPGSRAIEIWTHRVESLFLDTFGRPDPNQDPPCERTADTTVVQALHLMNAPNLHRKVTQRRRPRRRSWPPATRPPRADRRRAVPVGLQPLARRPSEAAGRRRSSSPRQRRLAGRRPKTCCGRC